MTQLIKAKNNTITPEMEKVAKEENIPVKTICEEVAQGRIVIPKNINHHFAAKGVGKYLKTKINANLGTSAECLHPQAELQKLKIAVQYGADSVMDLSTGGNLDEIRRLFIKNSPVMLGTVPIYGLAADLAAENKEILEMNEEMLFGEIEKQAKMGVDFITVHCGITQKSLSFLENSTRILGIVSRGGSLLARWIRYHGKENPLYAKFDYLCEICRTYDVTLSLGDGLRPGAQPDATDRGQIAELLVLGELVERAREMGVQVMVEGPGHLPLNQIQANVELQKAICKEAPFYVLGPLTTDIAPGYDHIVGAIGGALAASYGADFLCYVTPAEHLCLPTGEDVKQGVIASKIAAHSGDIAKNVSGARARDAAISKARAEFKWQDIFALSVDPETAKKRKENENEHCTMCGELCAVKTERKSRQEAKK